MGAGRDGPRRSDDDAREGARSSRSPYRASTAIDATINKENMLQRIHTWVPDPVLGDMNYEHEFTNDSYIDIGNGIKFPTGWHSHQGWDDNFQAQSVNAGHNAFGGTFKDVKANACGDPVAVPDVGAAGDVSGARRRRSKLADGVYLLGGARTTAWPSNSRTSSRSSKRRSTRRAAWRSSRKSSKLIPNKPIRFLVNTHQHFDHIGGLRTYMHIGATIITHWKNFDFYNRDVLNYAPRTLQPDMVSLLAADRARRRLLLSRRCGRTTCISDGTRIMHIYYVQPLAHVEGMLMAYLPKEKMLIEADLFDTARAAAGRRRPPRTGASTMKCRR